MKNFQILSLIFTLFMLNCSKSGGGGGILPLFGLGGDSSSGGITTSVSESASIKKVVIEPPSTTIVENGEAVFTATAFYSDGSSKDVTSEVSWTSEGTAMIVSSQGNSTSKDSKQPDSDSDFDSDSDSPLQPTKVGIKGLKKGIIKGWAGTAKVKATLDNVSGESNINVIASTDIEKIIFLDPPKLKPNSLFANIAKGANLPFYAIARLKTGKNLEVTNSVFWTVSDTSKGTFQTKGDLIGTFSALEDGIIWVQACFKDKFAEVCTERLYLSISKNAIKSLSIEGKDKLVKGMNTKLRLIAFYDDNSHADVTSQANWVSVDPNIVEVGQEPKFKSLITAKGTGSNLFESNPLFQNSAKTNIRASLQGLNIEKTIEVSEPSVVDLYIEKTSVSLPAGYTYKHIAKANFDDGETREVTNSVTWDSSDSTIAFAYNSSQPKGTVKAEKVGTVTITASISGMNPAVSTFKVTPAELLSISIGSDLTLPNGIGATLIPIGYFSDGTSRDLSLEQDLSWTVGDGVSIVTSDSKQSLSTRQVGKFSVVASLTTTKKVSSNPITVTVTDAILQAISLSPINVSLPKGKTQPLKAKGLYSDNTEKDITSEVTWVLANKDGSNDVGLGEVFNSIHPGLFTAGIEKEGSGRITATLLGKVSYIDFSVTSAVLESISVTSDTVPKGVSATIKATGFYSDKTSKDITRDASFTLNSGLSVDALGIISTADTNLSVGEYEIKATLDKKEAISTLTIKAADLKEISLGNEVTIAKGLSTTLTAIGIYTDKSKKDISKDVFWSGDINISSDPLNFGKIEATAVGNYKITATKGGVTTTSTVRVSPAVLESITIEPGNISLPKGTSQELKVFGKYTDGKREITNEVSYSLDSNGDGIADQILGGPETQGSQKFFTSNKLAELGKGKLKVSLGSVSAEITIETKPAILNSISVSPSTVPSGVPAILTAIGAYSDGTSKDITREVTFKTSDFLSIAQDTGLIQTTGIQGEYTITANLGEISTSTKVTITEAQLTSISVDAPASIAKGLTANFSAFGLYTDGSKKDLSSVVTWTGDKPSFISTSALKNGFFDAFRVDDIKVQASFNGVSSQLIPIKVLPASLVSLQIDQPKVSIPKGTSQTFKVTGTFTDGKRDLSSNVFWELSSPTLGSISNAPTSAGFFASNISSSTGTGKVIANYNGTKATADLEIKSAELVSISLNTPSSIPLGVSPGITATGVYTDGSTKEITSQISWTVTGTATVDLKGNIITSGVGTSTITATIGGVSISSSVTIKSAELVAITVSPAIEFLAKGTTTSLKANGVYTDGTNRDITKEVFWSADASKLSVENASGNQGKVKANNIGIATVSATLGDRMGAAVLTITQAELVSISLGVPKTIPDGTSTSFSAIGTYTDGSTKDISKDVTWTSSGKATINNGFLDAGKVYTSGEESTTIQASLNGITSSSVLTVSSPEITSLALSQSSLELAKGISSKLTVEAFLTNQKRVDVSSSVTWISDSNGDGVNDSTVVAVSNQASDKGTITTNSVGKANVTASLSGKSSTITITVKQAELVSISVTPANPSIAKGLTQQFTATGFYTDNSSADLTTSVSWMVGEGGSSGSSPQYSPLPSALTGGSTLSLPSSSSLASISNSDPSRGKLTAQGVGSVTVVAVQNSITGKISANLGSAVLQNISVTSDNSTKSKGLSEQFKATGVYSDGTTQDLSSQVSWKADSNGDGQDDSIVVSVSNESSTKGKLTAMGIGNAIVTATINGLSSTKSFSVSPAIILSVEFQNSLEIPTPTGSVAAGLTDSIKAIASYSDNTIQDITTNVTWMADSNGDGINDNLVATVDGNGIVKTVAPGIVRIIGSINGIITSKIITVLQPNLTKIEVTPSTGSIAEGYTQQFTATGTYSDGSKQDITSVTTWKSDSDGDNLDDGKVASISSILPTKGTAMGVKAGNVTITAWFNNQSATSTLTITPGVTKTQTVGSYDLTLPSGLSTTTTTPSGNFSGIVYTGGSGLTGFVSTIPDYSATSADTLGTAVVGKILNDSPDRISNTSIISSNTVNINNGGTVVYDMTLNTNTPMKPTDVSNHLIQEIGTNSPNGTVSNLPLPQGSETTSTDFRAIVQVTYNQYGSEMIGVGVTTATTYTNNQAIISTFLNGSNLIVTGTTLVDKTDTFTGTELPKVDFVWVVDNSGSMREEQSSVENNAITFFNKLNDKHLDFQLGVLATGNTSSKNAWELWGTGWVKKSDPKAADTFKSNVKVVGLSGSADESGIYFAERAIGGGPTPITATITPRLGAKLVFIILSDEGDHYQCYTGGTWRGDSYSKTVNGKVIYQPCDGGISFDANNNLFKTRGHRVYSIIGLDSSTGLAGTCSAKPTSAGTANNKNTAYFDLAKATGGSSSSICNVKYDDILENISTQSAAASSSYNLSRKPISSSIIVKTNGVTIAQDASNGWMYNSSSNSIVFSGSGWPAAGAKIEVSYKFDSSVAFNDSIESILSFFKTTVDSILHSFQS
jgi:trimeric autotransporter adhesin